MEDAPTSDTPGTSQDIFKDTQEGAEGSGVAEEEDLLHHSDDDDQKMSIQKM
jgi:hypothetical protein